MTLGAVPEALMPTGEDAETLERAVDPLDLLDPSEWAAIPTIVEEVWVVSL
jgi:hypothetical protein